MRSIGRLMQWFGLITLPLSMIMQLTGGLTVKQMLVMLGAGASAFYLGRIVEGYSLPR